MKRSILATVLGAFAALSMSGSARAGVVLSAEGWNVTNTAAMTATIAMLPSLGAAAPNVTFTSNGVEYSSFGNTTCFPPGNSCGPAGSESVDYTVDSWLKSIPGVASSIAYPGSTGSTEPSRILSDGSTTGTIFRFIGNADFQAGQAFTVNHDDGVSLLVGGICCDANGNLMTSGTNVVTDVGALVGLSPDATSPATLHFVYPSTGAPTGPQEVELIYAECCGEPAVFGSSLFTPTVVPEPTSLALLGSALVGFGAIRRRRNRV